MLVIGSLDASVQAQELPTASELKEKIVLRYQTLNSYHDKGLATEYDSYPFEAHFETFFTRKEGIKISWVEKYPRTTVESSVTFWGNQKCIMRYYERAGTRALNDDCRQFVSGLGYHSFVPLIVPGYFIPKLAPYSTSQASHVEQGEGPDGRKAYILVEGSANAIVRKTWVDAQSFHVIRYVECRNGKCGLFVDFDVVELNPPLSAAAVHFNPPFWAKYSLGHRPVLFTTALCVAAFSVGIFFEIGSIWIHRRNNFQESGRYSMKVLWRFLGIVAFFSTLFFVGLGILIGVLAPGGHPPAGIFVFFFFGLWVICLLTVASSLLGAQLASLLTKNTIRPGA